MNNPADARLPDDLTVLRNMRDAAVSEFRRKALDAAIAALTAAGAGGEAKVYSCDYCGSDYTDARYCCKARREYLNAHGMYETEPVRVFFKRVSWGAEDCITITGNPLDHVAAELITRIEPYPLTPTERTPQRGGDAVKALLADWHKQAAKLRGEIPSRRDGSDMRFMAACDVERCANELEAALASPGAAA